VGANRFPRLETRRAGLSALAERDNGRVEESKKHYLSRNFNQVTYVPNGTIIRQQRSISKLSDWGLTAGKYILSSDAPIRTPVNCAIVKTRICAFLIGLPAMPWMSCSPMPCLFVLPSDIEGLSLALLDAMGAGVCVLTSDIAENCETGWKAQVSHSNGEM